MKSPDTVPEHDSFVEDLGNSTYFTDNNTLQTYSHTSAVEQQQRYIY